MGELLDLTELLQHWHWLDEAEALLTRFRASTGFALRLISQPLVSAEKVAGKEQHGPAGVSLQSLLSAFSNWYRPSSPPPTLLICINWMS